MFKFLKDLFHSHTWSFEDNMVESTKLRYPVIRKCECGVTEIMHSKWSGQVSGKKGMIRVETPECWVTISDL